ncbi:unnamed protein product [Acidithrix sp. C25]|nr:unnamed protein product [Acidithrix sp. C25]
MLFIRRRVLSPMARAIWLKGLGVSLSIFMTVTSFLALGNSYLPE